MGHEPPFVEIAPPEPESAEGRSAASRLHSRRTAYERENQILAYGWRGLTRGDIARLNRLFEQTTEQVPRASLVHTEAALAIAASLYTGRKISQLAELPIKCIDFWPQGHDPVALSAALVRVGEHWGWWLPAGNPGKRNPGAKAESQTVSCADNLWLPVVPKIVELLRLSLSLRKIALPVLNVPLFETTVGDLRSAMKTLLRQDPAVRRAGTTVEAVERWLGGAIRLIPGGDAAVGRLVTTRSDLQSRTTSYYTSLAQPTLEHVWRRTVAPLTPLVVREPPSSLLSAQTFGTRNCPTEGALASLRKALVDDVANAKTAENMHAALTLYTVVLLTLALALRPTVEPALAADPFDRESGFGVVDDKRQEDGFTARLAWFPPVLRAQLDIYANHLARIRLSDGTQKSGANDSPSNNLFFKYDSCGALCPTSVSAILATLVHRHDCHFSPNFSRHFMRSKLVGRCSSETLHAFMGHWLRGSEPWGPTSGFDPLLYREDLSRVLVPALANRGWVNVGNWT